MRVKSAHQRNDAIAVDARVFEIKRGLLAPKSSELIVVVMMSFKKTELHQRVVAVERARESPYLRASNLSSKTAQDSTG